jgi:sugar fermentation stimulation protein A
MQVGQLVRRYKRFLADIIDARGEPLTLHCPNTGAMTGCTEPGSKVYYSCSDNKKRKYAHTLEFVETEHGLASVNTGRANSLVKDALHNGRIAEIGDLASDQIKPEAAIPGGAGRFDFLLSQQGLVTYVEVKSVTLHLEDGLGAFPDAVSVRALKHVSELQAQVNQGARGILLFCVQHEGIHRVCPAERIDPDYARGLRQAAQAGVEILAYGCKTDLQTMTLSHRLDFSLDP